MGCGRGNSDVGDASSRGCVCEVVLIISKAVYI